jgi:hypothetical protein
MITNICHPPARSTTLRVTSAAPCSTRLIPLPTLCEDWVHIAQTQYTCRSGMGQCRLRYAVCGSRGAQFTLRSQPRMTKLGYAQRPKQWKNKYIETLPRKWIRGSPGWGPRRSSCCCRCCSLQSHTNCYVSVLHRKSRQPSIKKLCKNWSECCYETTVNRESRTQDCQQVPCMHSIGHSNNCSLNKPHSAGSSLCPTQELRTTDKFRSCVSRGSRDRSVTLTHAGPEGGGGSCATVGGLQT